MKNVFIKYDPYSVETEIKIDGITVKEGSDLNITKGTRLQEFMDYLPQRLKKECYDSNFRITFHGTKTDFEDLETAFNEAKGIVHVEKICLEEVRSVDETEKEIDKIYEEIINSPYDEFHSEEIKKAFQDAKSQKFYVNVVATMSSGKSTLINALLGKEIMPVANQAKTAVVVRIENDDNATNFTAEVLDKNGKCVEKRNSVNIQDINRYNDNKDISEILLKGKIPFIRNSKIKLVLVDTPGVNNSNDETHRERTWNMLVNSEHSIVLYVMNLRQLETTDDDSFLKEICKEMNKKGRQSKDRFIFVVNQCDALKINNDGSVSKVLSKVRDYLKKHGIEDANIFPVSAAAASELRKGILPEDSEDELGPFAKKVQKYPQEFNFNSFTDFSHLPKSAQNNIATILNNADEIKKLEVFSGIYAIEQAISLYIDKYARTIKIKDLIGSFEGKIKYSDLKCRLEQEISKSQTAKNQASNMIAESKRIIDNGKKVQEISKKIDDTNFVKEISEKMQELTLPVTSELTNIIRKNEKKIPIYEAERIISSIQNNVKNLISKFKSDIGLFFSNTIEQNYQAIINEYKNALADLSINSKIGNYKIDFSVLADSISVKKIEITDTYIQTVDEGRYVKKYDKVEVPSSFFRKMFSWLPFVDEKVYETREVDEWIKDEKKYVELNSLVRDKLEPLQRAIIDIPKKFISEAEQESQQWKDNIKEEIKRINGLIAQEIDSWKQSYSRYEDSEQAIKHNETKMAWIEGIIKRIKSII